MGVYANYTAVSQDEIERAGQDQSLWGRLSFDPPDSYLQCDLQRSWSMLWYLLDPRKRTDENLTRPSNNPGKAVMGAHVFCEHFCVSEPYRQEVESAIRHPRYLSAEEVRTVVSELSGTTKAKLQKAYDPVLMERQVYSLSSPEDAWMWFEKLRDFYAEASGNGSAVVVHIL